MEAVASKVITLIGAELQDDAVNDARASELAAEVVGERSHSASKSCAALRAALLEPTAT